MERFDALAHGYRLFDPDDVKRGRLRELDLERARNHLVVRRPIRFWIGTDHVFRAEGRRAAADVLGRQGSPKGVVGYENGVECFAELPKALDVRVGESAFFIWGYIQEQDAVAADGLVVDVEQLVAAFGLLILVIKPTSTDGNVA